MKAFRINPTIIKFSLTTPKRPEERQGLVPRGVFAPIRAN
jgi:hypothetical protein